MFPKIVETQNLASPAKPIIIFFYMLYSQETQDFASVRIGVVYMLFSRGTLGFLCLWAIGMGYLRCIVGYDAILDHCVLYVHKIGVATKMGCC